MLEPETLKLETSNSQLLTPHPGPQNLHPKPGANRRRCFPGCCYETRHALPPEEADFQHSTVKSPRSSYTGLCPQEHSVQHRATLILPPGSLTPPKANAIKTKTSDVPSFSVQDRCRANWNAKRQKRPESGVQVHQFKISKCVPLRSTTGIAHHKQRVLKTLPLLRYIQGYCSHKRTPPPIRTP